MDKIRFIIVNEMRRYRHLVCKTYRWNTRISLYGVPKIKYHPRPDKNYIQIYPVHWLYSRSYLRHLLSFVSQFIISGGSLHHVYHCRKERDVSHCLFTRYITKLRSAQTIGVLTSYCSKTKKFPENKKCIMSVRID